MTTKFDTQGRLFFKIIPSIGHKIIFSSNNRKKIVSDKNVFYWPLCIIKPVTIKNNTTIKNKIITLMHFFLKGTNIYHGLYSISLF